MQAGGLINEGGEGLAFVLHFLFAFFNFRTLNVELARLSRDFDPCQSACMSCFRFLFLANLKSISEGLWEECVQPHRRDVGGACINTNKRHLTNENQ